MSCAPCQKAKGLAKSVGGWIGAGMPLAQAQLINNRMTLCRACEHFNGHLCAKCGCLMAVKARMATTKCPEGKW